MASFLPRQHASHAAWKHEHFDCFTFFWVISPVRTQCLVPSNCHAWSHHSLLHQRLFPHAHRSTPPPGHHASLVAKPLAQAMLHLLTHAESVMHAMLQPATHRSNLYAKALVINPMLSNVLLLFLALSLCSSHAISNNQVVTSMHTTGSIMPIPLYFPPTPGMIRPLPMHPYCQLMTVHQH